MEFIIGVEAVCLGNALFKKTITIASSLLFVTALTGCTTVAPSQGYRPAGSTAAPWQISGELFDFTNVRIFVNGAKVIDERLSLLSGDGEFHSSYRGKPVSTNCYTDGWGAIKCLVFVDNEKAATLSF